MVDGIWYSGESLYKALLYIVLEISALEIEKEFCRLFSAKIDERSCFHEPQAIESSTPNSYHRWERLAML